jgi:hypothetical protein
MKREELERARDEMRRELGRRRAVREGLPAEFGEAEVQVELTEELLAEAENVPASWEERARLVVRLQEAADQSLRISETLGGP